MSKDAKKLEMLGYFRNMLSYQQERNKQHDNSVHMYGQMGEYETDIDSETFVNRILSGMQQIAKANGDFKQFVDQYSDPEAEKRLIESVESYVRQNKREVDEADQALENVADKYRAARNDFVAAGGVLLTRSIDNAFPSSFCWDFGDEEVELMRNVYTDVLAKNGPFDKAIKSAGVSKEVAVHRPDQYKSRNPENQLPEVVMAPGSESWAASTLGNLINQEYAKRSLDSKIPESTIHKKIDDCVGELPKHQFDHRVLPLADCYVNMNIEYEEDGLKKTSRLLRQLLYRSEASASRSMGLG